MIRIKKMVMDAVQNAKFRNSGHAVMFHLFASRNVAMVFSMLVSVKIVMMVILMKMMDAFLIVQLMLYTGHVKMFKDFLPNVQVSVEMELWLVTKKKIVGVMMEILLIKMVVWEIVQCNQAGAVKGNLLCVLQSVEMVY